ncbi:MAG: PrsW family intramembrane metalloprotease [Spirochaetaceae bacterium]|nr:PrsW family intramembrane metalloprotease [Spirochaetaceae bacterium]
MSNGYFRLTWIISLFISAGGAWVWLKIVTRADPRWKDKGHRWYLYLLSGIGSLYLARLFYFLGFLIYGGNLYTPYDAANDLQFFLLINGPSEEWAKFIIFWILARGFKRVKEPRDGVIVAMMVALGFSLWENINYLIMFGTGSIPARLIWASSGHMAYAAIWGYFAGEAILEPPEGGFILKYRYVFTAVFVVSFVHGLFNFLSSWVSPGSALALDLIMYALTLIVLVQVCRVPSAYQAFPYEKSSEAVRAIRSALLRDSGNYLLYKRLGFYELYLGRESAALSSWKRITLSSRGPYLNAWVTILESRVGKGHDGLDRILSTMTGKNRTTLKRRLKFFLKSGSDIWLRRIKDWEQLKAVGRR